MTNSKARPESASTVKPLRADAAKNRLCLLEAAEAVFAQEGVTAPIDRVAERAGLGVGTLYRHFPTKEDLFEAIVMTRLHELTAQAAFFLEEPDPGTALFSFLKIFARHAAAKRDLLESLGSTGFDLKAQCMDSIEQLKSQLSRLVERAVRAGKVRSDVSVDEIIGLVIGAGHITTDAPVSLDRMVDIVCDGLRSKSSRHSE